MIISLVSPLRLASRRAAERLPSSTFLTCCRLHILTLRTTLRLGSLPWFARFLDIGGAKYIITSCSLSKILIKITYIVKLRYLSLIIYIYIYIFFFIYLFIYLFIYIYIYINNFKDILHLSMGSAGNLENSNNSNEHLPINSNIVWRYSDCVPGYSCEWPGLHQRSS